MEWFVFGMLSVGVLVAGIAGAYCLYKSKKKIFFLNGFHVLTGSVFLALFLLSLPAYWNEMGRTFSAAISAFFLSVYNAATIFAADGDYSVITANLSTETGLLYDYYTCYAAALFLFTPVLTVSFVLLFFNNIKASIKYRFSGNEEIYVFSDLNKKSITLAEDLVQNHSERTIVFTDYFEKNEEEFYELSARVKELGAICFKKSINAIDFCKKIKNKKIHFFAIGENETENIEQSLSLIKKYRDVMENEINLYTFSNCVESELLITAIDKGNVKVRRINEVRALVNRILQEHGTELFENAHEEENGMKKISAIIVGLGSHGSEMLKALSWYCQLDGYEIEMNAFDKDLLAYDKMYTQCPELISKEYNGVVVEGEAQYKIEIHSGVDVDSIQFMKKIQDIENPTYVLISLGSDAENIRIAAYLRMLFVRKGYKELPVIQAVINNSEKARALEGIKNFKNQEYQIQCVGDLKTSYSEKVIKNTKLENQALAVHMSYSIMGKTGEELEKARKEATDTFWKYEYNYRSSMATEIHKQVYKYCRRPGIGEIDGKLPAEERDAILKAVEHRRWNAYMRSEGYVYSGSPDSSSRNDLGKMHHNLVVYQDLSDEDKGKDGAVITGWNASNKL